MNALSPLPAPPALAISPRLRRTPFSARVEAAGVRSYTVYNRMLLPTAFQGLEEDYWHLREHVQLWDVSAERQVEISGPDASRLAQMLTPRNLSKIAVGQCAYAPITDGTGGILNDPVLLRLGKERFWLSIADSDLVLWVKGLAYGMGLSVDVFEPDVHPLAVQGPKADLLMERVFGPIVREIRFFRFKPLEFEGHQLVVARSGWSKQGGFEIHLDRPELGHKLWDVLWEAGEDLSVAAGCPNLIERIEGGLLSYGNDMTRDHTPLECGLERFCALDGDIEFVGRAALRKQRTKGIPRMVRGLIFGGPRCPAQVEPWLVTAGDTAVGQISSAVYSPALEANIAIAMIATGHEEPGTAVTVQTPVGPAEAEVRTLPFDVPPI
ncbi:MAG: dimethylsulfoniopropionate demethylase [Pseudomonadota bacterium]